MIIICNALAKLYSSINGNRVNKCIRTVSYLRNIDYVLDN